MFEVYSGSVLIMYCPENLIDLKWAGRLPGAAASSVHQENVMVRQTVKCTGPLNVDFSLSVKSEQEGHGRKSAQNTLW